MEFTGDAFGATIVPSRRSLLGLQNDRTAGLETYTNQDQGSIVRPS